MKNGRRSVNENEATTANQTENMPETNSMRLEQQSFGLHLRDSMRDTVKSVHTSGFGLHERSSVPDRSIISQKKSNNALALAKSKVATA